MAAGRTGLDTGNRLATGLLLLLTVVDEPVLAAGGGGGDVVFTEAMDLPPALVDEDCWSGKDDFVSVDDVSTKRTLGAFSSFLSFFIRRVT